MKVVIRADASRSIGGGHVMRCLAVAEALRERGATVHFICRMLDGHLGDLIEQSGYEVLALPAAKSDSPASGGSEHAGWLGVSWQQDAHETTEAISTLAARPDWLIVDHYALDASWETSLRATADRILVLDDLADRQHECDLLLDQNLYEDAQVRYVGKVPDRCRILVGPRHALLRPEFRRARLALRERCGTVRRILVFFGAAHAPEWAMLAIEALASIPHEDVHVDVVIGGQQLKRREIEQACSEHGFVCHVQTQRMAELMSAADLAIGAGGSAHWERCCLGLPCLTFAVATNQRRLVHDSALAGLLYAPEGGMPDRDTLARHLQACLQNPLLLGALSRNALAAVDGRGAARLLRAMGILAVNVRPAQARDRDRMFEWRNHPQTRAVSRNTAPLSRSGHAAWFASVLADGSRMLVIGELAGEPVGVVRFDIVEDTAEVSIYTVPVNGGQGRSAELLLAAERLLCRTRPEVRSLRAEVLEGNVPSQRLFASAAYSAQSFIYSKRLPER